MLDQEDSITPEPEDKSYLYEDGYFDSDDDPAEELV